MEHKKEPIEEIEAYGKAPMEDLVAKKYASLLKIDRAAAQQILADMIGQP